MQVVGYLPLYRVTLFIIILFKFLSIVGALLFDVLVCTTASTYFPSVANVALP